MVVAEVVGGVHRVERAYVDFHLVRDDGGHLLMVDTGLPATWALFGQALRELGHRPADIAA
ncbi:hypothetical protein [Promicromonospora umidemergens]|uniref:Metallo-beta-lactamase superfamily protein n=1 Tax=Promicromonospora umidemergens TaxID=629679 RepID=A0ABP8WZ72_9MICO|nr:hypothetical protein [Promicromonospora umidemergens]